MVFILYKLSSYTNSTHKSMSYTKENVCHTQKDIVGPIVHGPYLMMGEDRWVVIFIQNFDYDSA